MLRPRLPRPPWPRPRRARAGAGTVRAEPARTCVGCRRVRPADELVRVTRDASGSLAVGRSQPGRGAWLCRDSPGCVTNALGRRAFDRALRGPVVVTDAEALMRQVLGAGRGGEGSAEASR